MSLNPSATAKVVQRDPIPVPMTYSTVLRVIGQDIAGFFPKTLDITTDGVSFEARGQCHPNPFEASKETFLARIWRRVACKTSAATPQEKPPPACFVRTYDAADIERLDRVSRADREEGSRRADAYSLSERFRTMGVIVDKGNGSLKCLHKEADRLLLEYWDAQGQLQCAKLTTVIFYRNQHVDPRHHHVPTELWEGYDF